MFLSDRMPAHIGLDSDAIRLTPAARLTRVRKVPCSRGVSRLDERNHDLATRTKLADGV